MSRRDLNRRAFLAACSGVFASVFALPAIASPPPFKLVRARLKRSKSRRLHARLTRLGDSIEDWKGVLVGGQESVLSGASKITWSTSSPKTGIALCAALISPDPIGALETRFGGIRVDRASIETHRDRFAYRFGENPQVLVLRESWDLVEVWWHDGKKTWQAQIESTGGVVSRIRVLVNKSPRWTLRLDPV